MERFMKRQYDQAEIYYVYGHYNPGTDEIFYVGKGKGSRSHSSNGRQCNPFWLNIVEKYNGFDVKLLLENLKEYDALCMESMFINAYGRRNLGKGPLVNLTDGGDSPPILLGNKNGMFGKNHADNSLEMMRDAATARVSNPDYINPFKNKTHKQDSINQMKQSHAGSTLPESAIQKLKILLIGNTRGRGNKGKSKSELHCNNISIGLKGNTRGRGNKGLPSKIKGTSKYFWVVEQNESIIKFNTRNELSQYLNMPEGTVYTRVRTMATINGIKLYRELK